jgi:hypothetical protein
MSQKKKNWTSTRLYKRATYLIIGENGIRKIITGWIILLAKKMSIPAKEERNV